MKIGIDISQMAYEGTGVARFTNGLLSQILNQNDHHTWDLYYYSLRHALNSDLIRTISAKKNVKLHTYTVPQSLLSFTTYHLRPLIKFLLPYMVPSLSLLDWFITSDWIEFPIPTRRATIIHDLIFEKYPNTVHPRIRKMQKRRLSLASDESDLIITDSISTSHDLQEKFPKVLQKTKVIYPGLSPLSRNKIPSDVFQRLGIHDPFILSVGKREPRKNIPILLQAFKMQKKITPKLQLVIVGSYGWGDDIVPENSDIIVTGFLADEVLYELYQKAICFVFPSMYEGFGYPIGEALMYGCPVATSNTSSMPEVAGDAALYFDPSDPGAIHDAISQLILHENLRKELIAKGIEQAKKFSWVSYYNQFIHALSE